MKYPAAQPVALVALEQLTQPAPTVEQLTQEELLMFK
jgi:hypothetical protein